MNPLVSSDRRVARLLLPCFCTQLSLVALLSEVAVIEPANPVPCGQRLLGIAISEGEIGFEAAFREVRKAGIQIVELNLPWDMFEQEKGKYQDPYGLLPATAYYGANNIQVCFSLAVINTVKRTTPAYLNGLEWDDPEVVGAFNRLMDWFLAQVPNNVTVAAISVGNEVDLYLEGEPSWKRYSHFVESTIRHLRERHPKIRYGVKTTVTEGVFGGELDQVRNVNQWSDVIMLNLYPQDESFQVDDPKTIHQHLDRIVHAFPDKTVWMTELGYQSGEKHCGSSPAKQARFYHEFFRAWDKHRDQIQMVMINWLHDQPARQVEEWTKYYGLAAPAFAEFLATLGLRHADGTDKPAWKQIVAETRMRGWD
jgi:hypothetical protein